MKINKLVVHFFVLSSLLFLTLRPSQAVEPASALTVYGSIHSVSGELRRLADDALAAGDQVMHNRIEQALNGLTRLLRNLEPLIKSAQTAGNDVVNNAARESVGILSELHADGSSAGNYASAKLNLTLANASALMSSIPFVDVPPAVFALSPTRIEIDQRARLIRVFGHLPGDVNDDVVFWVNDRKVEAKRGSGGSISFRLPAGLQLAHEQEIQIRIEADEHFGPGDLFWRTHKFAESVLVGKAKPFTCTVSTYRDNPEYLTRVKATGSMHFDANTQGGRRRPNEDRTVNADDLFAATMGDAAREYDASTATVVDAGFSFQRWGQCGGRGPSGNHEILASGKAVRVRLHAPELSARPFRGCDAGGTHAHATVTPTFLVARKDAQPLVLAKTDTFSLGSVGLDLSYPMPPAAPWSLHTKCAFKEATESWFTRTMVITPRDTQESARGIGARLVDTRLLIEPLDPLRFDDQLR